MLHKGLRIALRISLGFVALTAISGGAALLLGAEAQRFPLDWLHGTPFSDYTIPALLLAIVVGGSALLAVIALWVRPRLGAASGIAAGLILMGYIAIEALILKQVPPGPSAIEAFYFSLGLLNFSLSVALLKFQHTATKEQKAFHGQISQ